ncbi:DDT domain-containing protein DDB_G0282237-like isoform X2 [Phoenix dactylifera]|uniref:DDT domain-containing protein DDB_G0282237-like isoform X2 n=1 Tax=Phoenix dactylifera TaxID=42345 RepID=A0A8B8J6S5_PHODC|nr:DDT domain-containing protein DDB_G0282237-like isoform X2 [Phoenix dactylifera]
MPLYKRKPFSLVESPQHLDPQELVFQVRFTKEIFQDYQKYLKRLNLYRQRVWTCKVTGKTNLTYEEAFVSERRAMEKVQQFPKELMAPVLHMIQYSSLSLKDLVNEIYIKLQERLFEGLELHGRKEQSVFACKILMILDDGHNMQYKVGWVDKGKKVTDTSIIKAEDLIRKKPPFSRNILKAFIRESTSKSAPWVVHENLAKKHGISTEFPEELRDKLTIRNGKERKNAGRNNIMDAGDNRINKKRKNTKNENLEGMDMINKKIKKEEEKMKEKPVKYPIDDLLVQPGADDPVFTDRPTLSTDFCVPMDCLGDLLMVWDFCSSFNRLLHLWPFSLDDFENAICHKDSNLMLIVELHSAIIRLLIKDESDYFMAIQNKKRKLKITLTNWSEYLCDFLEMEDRVELSSHVTTIKRGHYGLLDIYVKLGILRELVSEALSTDAVREKLDDCIEQQQALAATRREGTRKKKDDQHLKEEETDVKEMDQEHIVGNGKENSCNSALAQGTKSVHSFKNNHISQNGDSKCDLSNSRETANKLRMDDGGGMERVKSLSGTKDNMKGQRRGKDKDKEAREKKPEDRERHLEREIEKLSIRTASLGKDRNYNRYWFFRREGRLFVESSDHKQWGYYSAKEELDALMGSLNPKGERERALQRQLEKYYHRISTALQKRSKDVAQKILLEEAVLRRSTRVRAQPRDSPAMAFLRYVNKWKEN